MLNLNICEREYSAARVWVLPFILFVAAYLQNVLLAMSLKIYGLDTHLIMMSITPTGNLIAPLRICLCSRRKKSNKGVHTPK
jgi:hypothetical protein